MQIRAIGDSVARWTLVALISLMPFFVIPTAWATVVQGKLLLAGILMAIALVFYVIARLAQGVVLIPRDTILYAAFLLPLFYLFSALLSGSSAASYASGLGMQDTVASMTLLFAALALAAVLFAGGVRNVLLVFLLFLSGCAVVIVFQMLRLLAPAWLSLGGALSGSASSIFGSWHDLGILAALLIFFAVALFDSPFLGKKISTISMPVLGVLSFALLFVIGLPDIWYSLAVLFAALTLLSLFFARRLSGSSAEHAAKKAIASFILAIIAGALGFGGHFLYPHLPAALQITSTEVRPSWSGTFAVGEKVFSSNGPLFGAGPNAFQNAWGKFKPTAINETVFWSTDFNQGVGFVPTSFVTAGVLGILAWILLLLAILFHTVSFVRSQSHDFSLHASLLGGSLFLLAFHVFYTPTLATSLILFFLLGLLVALATSDRAHVFALPLAVRSIKGIAPLILILALGTGVLLASYATVRAAVSDLIIQKAAADFNVSGDVPRALSLVEKALIVNPKNDRAHRAAVELGLQQLGKLIAAGNKADASTLKAALSDTIASGLAAVSIDSGDYQNWLSLAGAYQNLASVGVAGAYENAIAAYEKAAAANPTNPLPLIGAGQVALAQGQASTSVHYLDAAIVLKTNLAVAYYLRSQGEGLMGNYTAAIDDAKKAIALAQQDPLGWYNLGTLLYVSGDYQAAAEALTQAISLNNTYSNALFVLSLTLNKLNDNEQAIALMQKVVELNPTNETASSTLANLLAASSTPSSTKTEAR